MVFGMQSTDGTHDAKLYEMRRSDLIRRIKEKFPEHDGFVILFAGFEEERVRFSQDSSFFYLTGISDPGVVLILDLEGKATLYVPYFSAIDRTRWTGSGLQAQEYLTMYGISEVQQLGCVSKGYKTCMAPTRDEYKGLLEFLSKELKESMHFFTLSPESGHEYCWQRLLLGHLNSFIPGFSQMNLDISSIIERMRRKKDLFEIEQLYKATDITMLAHEAAAQSIMPNSNERETQASLEYMIIGSGAQCAFPSIVASGKQSTILHYTDNNAVMKSDDLVIVDIGAKYNNYCADITRTYPVSGYFSSRQREIYEVVLKTQEYIASLVRPGYWLCNKDQPDRSLNHLAREFLKNEGYEDYILHGIGHFLGLDVHDVGDMNEPLAENDIITIEPGIYLPKENIGIRIEDDYWVVKDGAICLSEALPKKTDEIESLVQQKFDNEVASPSADYDFIEDEIDA